MGCIFNSKQVQRGDDELCTSKVVLAPLGMLNEGCLQRLTKRQKEN